MVDRKTSIIILLLVLSLPFVFSELDVETRTYLEQQNQKTVAQINSKIDGQVTRIENDLQNNLKSAKEDLRKQIADDIKSALKSIAIGLAGMVIVSLGVFKIVDTRINYHQSIKKYEKQLQEEKEKYEKLIKEVNKYKEDLNKYRDSLANYQSSSHIPKKEVIPVPKPKETVIGWKHVIGFIIIIIIISVSITVFLYLRR